MASDGGNKVGQASGSDAASLREYQELWFALQKREWTSVVLVPADPGGAAAKIGKALADIGSRVSKIPVTAIAVNSMSYDSAFALADLHRHVDRDRRGIVDQTPLIEVTGKVIREGPPAGRGEGQPAPGGAGSTEALALLPAARLVVAIPPIVSEPLGLAAAHSADAIVVIVEIGRTRMADARRTVDLIGRERIAGCFIVR